MRVRRRTPRIAAALMIGALVASACGSGKSALQAGMDEPDTVAPVPSAATTDAASPGGTDPTGSTGSAATTAAPPATPAPTTTQSPLADQPACPTGALDGASGPVDITFWHGMANELETSLIALTDDYNASQDRVHVDLQNQTSYNSAIDKYIQSSQDSRPTLIQFPEYVVQSFAQSDTLIPIEACLQDSGYDTSAFLERTLDAYTFEGIRWAMPFNVSNPVLYYNRQMFEAAGLDPDASPVSLDDLRANLADHRRQRRGELRLGGRFGSRLGRWLVPRAVVRPGRSALRRQRQRPARSRDAGAVRRSDRHRSAHASSSR